MKKIICFIFILLICAAAVRTTGSLSALQQVTENTHLSAPVAVAADSDRVIVAEIYGGRHKLHIFSDKAPYLKTVENAFDGDIVKMRSNGQFLYIHQPDCLIVYNLVTYQAEFLIEEAITAFDINDTLFCFTFDVTDDDGVTETYIKTLDLTVLSAATELKTVTGAQPYSNKTFDIAVSSTEISVLYYTSTTQPTARQRRLLLSNYSILSAVSAPLGSKVFTADSEFWLYTPTSLHDDNSLIADDVAYVNQNEIYLLNRSDCRVYQYVRGENGFEQTDVVFGSNARNYQLPYLPSKALNGRSDFRLAYINSVNAFMYFPEALGEENKDLGHFGYYADNGQPALVFGSAVSGFYYVWHGGRFSFVAESFLTFEGAGNPLSQDYAAGTTKIPATANQKLYYLPLNDSAQVAVNNVPADTDITLITHLTSFSGGNWSFVSFRYNNADIFGFMLNSAFADRPQVVPTFEIYRANPPALSSLNVFAEKDEASEIIAKIASGGEVKVYEKGEVWSKVKVTVNGQTLEGFVKTQELINRGLTNTFAAGLVVGIGLIIIIIMIVFFTKRRKGSTGRTVKDAALFSDLDKLD